MSVVRQTSLPAPTTPAPSFVKRFDTPQRSVGFGDARLDIITIGGRSVGRGSFAAGWKWTPAPGTPAAAFAGVVLSGRAKVKTKSGESADLTPGDFFAVTPEDEFWVVGLRPCEILYLDGIDALS